MPPQSVPLAYRRCASEGCANKALPEEMVISPLGVFTRCGMIFWLRTICGYREVRG